MFSRELLIKKNKILTAIKEFQLNLKGKLVLTEAATGNFCITPVIAALAGADVIAYTKDSKYGSADQAKKVVLRLAKICGVLDKISIIEELEHVDLKRVEVVTNVGLLRPINRKLISSLSSRCVIPLMWEPWEYRKADLDLACCYEKGIKVYGTNESDIRLQTVFHLGYLIVYFLLHCGLTPFSANILVLGNNRFVGPVAKILNKMGYHFSVRNSYDDKLAQAQVGKYNFIVLLEHQKSDLLIGKEIAFIDVSYISSITKVLHICGNADFYGAKFEFFPKEPAFFGHMSFTADFIDDIAAIDLHTAGLKVSEGMLLANKKGLIGKRYKDFMEENYPALAFDELRYW